MPRKEYLLRLRKRQEHLAGIDIINILKTLSGISGFIILLWSLTYNSGKFKDYIKKNPTMKTTCQQIKKILPQIINIYTVINALFLIFVLIQHYYIDFYFIFVVVGVYGLNIGINLWYETDGKDLC